MAALALQVKGTFDVGAAARLAEVLRAAPRDAELCVDFSRVRDFRDNTIEVLCRTLGEVGPRLSIEGLTQHQLRLLRYFAVPSPAASSAAAAQQH